MKTDHFSLSIFLSAFILFLFTADWANGQQDQTDRAFPGEQQVRLGIMKSKGIDASLTILPVSLVGNPTAGVSEVIGLLLEQQGLKDIEVGKTAFTTSGRIALKDLADSVGDFVKRNPIKTAYALYVEMNGDPKKHAIEELIGIVVDQSGAVVWKDRLSKADEVFRQVGDPDPMGFSVLLAQRLGPQMGLNEETARNAKPGKMRAIMNERSGIPPENETAAIPARQQVMKEKFSKSALMVFPLRVNGQANNKGADELVKMINDMRMCKASAAKDEVLLKSSQEGPNELKKLWDLARDFRDYVKKNPVDADYALYADYIPTGYVHFVVCDRSGEWVITDLQNSTRTEFRAFNVAEVDGCNKLVVNRLQQYLKTSVADVLRKTINDSGISAGEAKFEKLRANMDGYYLSEEEMNALGYEFLFAKKTAEAIAVFKMNVVAFPGSWNAYDSLGEAYAAAGEKKLAIRNYEKSVELNPNSLSGTEALKRLKAK
ncbi:MAG TPA: hypothetical protein PKN44_02005 [Bacteroidales bacterium]|nr:hypothetical protein [Bacteroidales bacterium]HPS49635.1 hypothetical protein [Bacteroidales bacterium]